MVKEISLLLGALLAAGLPVSAQAPASDETLNELKKQMAEMAAQIEKLASKS